MPKTRTLPVRKQIDPVELPRPIIPYIQLITVFWDKRDYRFDLVGAKPRSRFQKNPIGLNASEFHPPAYLEYLFRHIELMNDVKKPVYSESRLHDNADLMVRGRRVFTPFLDGISDSVSACLIVSCHTLEDRKGNWPPVVVTADSFETVWDDVLKGIQPQAKETVLS